MTSLVYSPRSSWIESRVQSRVNGEPRDKPTKLGDAGGRELGNRNDRQTDDDDDDDDDASGRLR